MAERTQELIDRPELLARPQVIALTPYQSARRIVAAAGGRGDIWLNANESAEFDPYVLTREASERLNRYPDAQPGEVIARYAAYSGANPAGILATRGGDEGIDLLIRTFCRAGEDAVLTFPPTYGMYEVSAETAGGRVEKLVTDPATGWTPDADALEEKLAADPSIRVVFACSPNNPTGNLIPSAVIERLVEATRGRAILVIDEAYVDFAPEATALGRIASAPHLVLIRTLSKAFALAGIRCGFLIGSEAVIGMLRKVIAPYPIPTPVADIAEQALSPAGVSAMRERAAGMIARREALSQRIRLLPGVLAVEPSSANFILVKFADSAKVFSALWNRGIILRDQGRQATLDGCVRITVGAEEENLELLAALSETLEAGAPAEGEA